MREIKMIAWINALTDMPDWHRKIFDPDFTFEWKSAKDLTGYDVTRSMVDWDSKMPSPQFEANSVLKKVRYTT
ncbi:MAG: hypothetical protein Q9203_006940 [Teloschistes exilis]